MTGCDGVLDRLITLGAETTFKPPTSRLVVSPALRVPAKPSRFEWDSGTQMHERRSSFASAIPDDPLAATTHVGTHVPLQCELSTRVPSPRRVG